MPRARRSGSSGRTPDPARCRRPPSIGSVVDDDLIVVVRPVQADDRQVPARLGHQARQLLAVQAFHPVSITHASRAVRQMWRGCRARRRPPVEASSASVDGASSRFPGRRRSLVGRGPHPETECLEERPETYRRVPPLETRWNEIQTAIVEGDEDRGDCQHEVADGEESERTSRPSVQRTTPQVRH